MFMLNKSPRRHHEGGRLIKTARGIFSLAATVGGVSLFGATMATAQAIVPQDCQPGTTGPNAGSTVPYIGGMCDLGSVQADNLGDSRASAISTDGTVIVGRSEVSGERRAFRWTNDGMGMLDLGTLRNGNLGESEATAVSADGAVIVGRAEAGDANPSGDYDRRAFRWIDDGMGMLDLGTLRNGNLGESEATAVSADGAVIVGNAATDSEQQAFRWTENGGLLNLGTLTSGNSGQSFALAISANGEVIVGYADNGTISERAFRWIDDGMGMLDLGTLASDNSGESVAESVSADGSIIVGRAEDDGGDFRAFIWRTQMQDFTNLMMSFPVLANDTEIAVAQQQFTVGRLMDMTCLAGADQSCLRVDGWLSNTGTTTGDNIGEGNSQSATLTYGRGLDGQTTIGGTLLIKGTDLGANSFDMGGTAGFSLWTEYSETGLARTGWQASAALGWSNGTADISRGRGLDNVMIATGEADLSTVGVSAILGYGFQQQDWLLTPSLSLAHFETRRDGYAETGGDFNATYDSLTMNRTTVTLQLDAERTISETGTLLLGAGFEHDLSADRVTLTGTSDLPGLESFAVGSTLERRETRGFASVGYTHDLGNNRALTGTLRVGQSAFGNEPQVTAGLGFSMRF